MQLTDQRVREIDVMPLARFWALPARERNAYMRIPVPHERVGEIIRRMNLRGRPSA